MRIVALVAQMTVRLTGVFLIVIGLVYWAGYAPGWIDAHRGIGYAFVVAIWVLAGVAWQGGVPRGLVLFVALWALLVPLLGLTQQRLIPGPAHWIVRVLHLLVGLFAIRLAEDLGKRIRAALGARSS
jgi:hypothetical protein